MIQSHYIPLERPFRIIYAQGNVGLQIGTLIVVDDLASYANESMFARDRNGAHHFGYMGIRPYSYPVVSYINKNKNDLKVPISDIEFGGGSWREAEVWPIDPKNVATLCLEGGNVKWESMLEILVPNLRRCRSYDDHVGELINIFGIINSIKSLGGSLKGPNLEMTSHMDLPEGETRVIVPLTCERQDDGSLIFQTSQADSMIEKPFQFYAHVNAVEEAVKIIKRQELFYRRLKVAGELAKSFSIIYNDERKQSADGRIELLKLIEHLKQKCD